MVQKKQANKPVKTNLKSKKGILKIVFILLGVALIATVIYALVSDIASRKTQLDSLNRASDDLHQLYTDIVGSVAVVDGTSSYSKKCFQASAKFSKGEIVCGPRGEFISDVSYDTIKQEDNIYSYVEQNKAFEKISIEEFNKGERDEWSSTDFIHRESSAKCFIDRKADDSNTKYTLGCNMSVPNFLPGYEIEE